MFHQERSAVESTAEGVSRHGGGESAGGGWAPGASRDARISRLAAAVSFAVALGLALGLAGVARPEVIFPKYLAAAVAAPGEQAERLLDYSPL
jgi:hypothetical protein